MVSLYCFVSLHACHPATGGGRQLGGSSHHAPTSYYRIIVLPDPAHVANELLLLLNELLCALLLPRMALLMAVGQMLLSEASIKARALPKADIPERHQSATIPNPCCTTLQGP